jgi:hypothetical protein
VLDFNIEDDSKNYKPSQKVMGAYIYITNKQRSIIVHNSHMNCSGTLATSEFLENKYLNLFV